MEKYIVPYLPYQVEYESNGEIETLKSVDTGLKMVNFGWGNSKKFEEIKLILRPLSDLTKEIEVNGEKFVPIEWLLENREVDAEFDFISALENDWACAEDKIIFAPLSIAQKLLEWHFDIYGLIEKGLAIDKNTLL